jgi:2-phospho-L-lactate guanylyltransferase
MAQALLPLKDLVQAKTRLAGLLRPSERRALAQAMAEDVLSVLAGHPEIVRVTLVSDDPGGELLARKYGADCWPERSLGCSGLNALMQCASERLLGNEQAPLIVLHADLPLLASGDITEVLSLQKAKGGLVIGSDRQGRGTNLLAFDASAVPNFSFGVDSCDAHISGARKAGIPVTLCRRPGVFADVDDPADLQWVMDRLAYHRLGNTAALLHDNPLGARLAMALASMPGIVSGDAGGVEQPNSGSVA